MPGTGTHLYNAWLPPPVAAEAAEKEKSAFAAAVKSVRGKWRPGEPDSVYATLKWISPLDLFIRAKSDLETSDVQELINFGLEVFHASQNKLYAQVRWGALVSRYLKKHGKKLTSLTIQWRPLYDSLMNAHFKKNTGPEGWKIRQWHFETVTSLVRACRQFFPSGSASEIWSEFRSLMENPWHNSAFEGCGFAMLFLPGNSKNQDYYNTDWIAKCIDLWDSVPNCQFWDFGWTTIIARCIKNCKVVDWEQFLPVLFSRYLNMFEVPVSNASGSYPFPIEVPRNIRYFFSSKSGAPAKAIAKSIVYLLKPTSSAQVHFEKLASLLEQYYHPSNGGRWSYTLERFLRYLVNFFEKRLQNEQLHLQDRKEDEIYLGEVERSAFIKVLLKLLDQGQYSKNESLAETVSVSSSLLSYVEPAIVLPFITKNFQLALETTTATHQLKNALTSVAYASRPLLLTSHSITFRSGEDELNVSFSDVIALSLSNALLGLDANDPPKTLATMQLVGSIFSSLTTVGAAADEPDFLESIHLSEWLDEFFDRLFSVLQNLESSNAINEDTQSTMTGTFLVEDSPYYFCMLVILLGKLSKPLLSQSLKKIAKFVNTNITPGAIYEVGLLCCACVQSDPEEAAVNIIKPLLITILSSFKGCPMTGFGGRGISSTYSSKAKLSPALETALEYHLRVLGITISFAGSVVLHYLSELSEAITSAFEVSSWKVNGAGDHVLRSLLGCLITYYPLDQYKSIASIPIASYVELWVCTKSYQKEINHELNCAPKWHIPSSEELEFAKKLLELHFQSALNELLAICQEGTHTDAGEEKEHIKVTLLRVYSSLQGVVSCLPDMRPLCKNGASETVDCGNYFIAGSSGSTVGSSELREKAAETIHTVCRYLLKERSDDSILLILIIRVMDALGNYGSLEYEEWSNHLQAWKLESAAIIEPPCNFIISSHADGKKRPRWALVDKTFMHSMWRSSQSSYHKYRTDSNVAPPEPLVFFTDDLMDLSLHNYETVRAFAGRSLTKLLKRWPSLVSKCVAALTDYLRDPKVPEHTLLGACNILATSSILRHLSSDPVSFTSFIAGVLASSHHDSLKVQKAIIELFVKYNISFSGVSSKLFKKHDDQDKPEYVDLFKQFLFLSQNTNGLHWRYNLMANRVLLLLLLSSRSESQLSPKELKEAVGHFLRNLKSELPHSRMLAISALNTLLQGSPSKLSHHDPLSFSVTLENHNTSSTEDLLSQILKEEGFLSDALSSLSNVHSTSDVDGSATKGNHATSFQSGADKAITYFYFDFSASWPRTPTWMSSISDDTFYSSFARIFKRLLQQCGTPIFYELKNAIEEFIVAEERTKQCVAAEVFAGILHSDISGILDLWDESLVSKLQQIISIPSVESIPEWAACIRYAVTGKGKYGTRVPLLREKILDCLVRPLPDYTSTNILAKRYYFISVSMIEIFPPMMRASELQFHYKILDELLDNMNHSSAQVREAIGVALSIACSNIRLSGTSDLNCLKREDAVDVRMTEQVGSESWAKLLTEGAHDLSLNIQKAIQAMNEPLSDSVTDGPDEYDIVDIKKMETKFHLIIACFRSGRFSVLLDIIVRLIYPVLSLQETSNKDLSMLAKAAFELLKWVAIPRPFLEDALAVILSSLSDLNWRTRSASLSFIQAFMYRHTFILFPAEKLQIWQSIEKLLVDNQVEVREHAAGVLANLMKGGEEALSKDFRDRSYAQAETIVKSWGKRDSAPRKQTVADVHGAALALTASVLSAPYDMPSWLPDHVTLLARFIVEPSPIKSTVTKAVAEFRRTHADKWMLHMEAFTEDQLELLRDTSSSSSYFA